MKLNQLTLTVALEKIKQREISASEIWQDCQSAINEKNKELNVYTHIADKDSAPENLDADLINKSPLLGAPLALKDNFCTFDQPTTASSNLLRDFQPAYDATVVDRLRQAGASFLGKTNLDAWAHGSSTESSDFGPTLNPRNPEHVPGGSSGGSSAAVAADFCLAALGSETAGSIRQPAALCGTVGFRPTYGRTSRYGVASMASSLDTPGFLTKTVADSALLTNIIAGPDPYDATTLTEQMPDLSQVLISESSLKKTPQPLKNYKIGVQYLTDANFENLLEYYQPVVETFQKLGAQVEFIPTSLNPNLAIADYTVLQRSEVSSNLARYDGVRYGRDRSYFGAEAKRRIMLGTYTLSKGYADRYYVLAQKVRTLFINDFQKLFQSYDLLISPSYPGFAKKLGAADDSLINGEMEDILVEPSALAGLPGISVPCYRDPQTNLYLGLNIMGNLFQEAEVIKVASAYEVATTWNSWLNSDQK